MDYIKQTENFLKETFINGLYMQANEADGNYRIEHSYRVANIAGEIAQKEGLDVEGLIIAGLLHDIAYSEGFASDDDWANHGRKSAEIARTFLENTGMEAGRIQDICFGIAIHVDDKSDFDGQRTPFTLSISDADNIDRFDAYRIYESLQYRKFSSMPLADKLAKVTSILSKSEEFLQMPLGTKTAQQIWTARLEFQKEFFLRVNAQLNNSQAIDKQYL